MELTDVRGDFNTPELEELEETFLAEAQIAPACEVVGRPREAFRTRRKRLAGPPTGRNEARRGADMRIGVL